MTIAFLASGHSAGAQTTAAVDTTGADLLVVAANSPNGYNLATDSKSSGTWVNQAQVKNTAGAFFTRINYLLAPSPVGSGHTFSTSPSVFYGGVSVASFSGVASLNQAQSIKEDTAAGTSHASSAAAVTPTVNGCAVVTAFFCVDDPGTITPPAGFTLINGPAASAWTIAWAYQIQTTATSVTPVWTTSNSVKSCGSTSVFAPSVGGDTTPPTLTSPTGTGGTGVCSGSVTTNEANGTLYSVATASATAPTAAQVKLGQDNTGTAAPRALSQTVSATGAQTITSGAVSAGTRYFHYMHEDAAANQSTVSSSASFVVSASGDTTPPTLAGTITIGTVTSTSIQMSWPAGADNVAVTSYEVSSNNGSSYSDVGNVLTYTFTVLTASTSYGLRVRAKDASGNVSTPALAATQSTTASGAALTSSPIKNNTGSLQLSVAAEAFVHNVTTGALVIKKTGLTSHATTGVIAFSDAAINAATTYRVVWRLPVTGAEGMETLTAA